MANETLPVLIIGAGISGLLLAQQLRKLNIPYRIFDRDDDFTTRGVGWGMTLHWSLPALRECLPDDVLCQVPQAYVDRAAVERGEQTAYPFFNLNTGEFQAATPKLPESQRIRVSRQRLRGVLATGVDVQWRKAFQRYEEGEESIKVTFEDGSICEGRLLVGCDGSHSKVRRSVFPNEHANYHVPVRLFGFTMRKTAEEARPIRDIDPFVVYGATSEQNSFMFLSVLDGPDDNEDTRGGYVYSTCISRYLREEEKNGAHKRGGSTKEYRVQSVKEIATQFAEPFRTFLLSSIDNAEVKQINLEDFLPPVYRDGADPPRPARVVLVGDALHNMTMYRGEGANHAIVDVLEMNEKVLPYLNIGREALRGAVCEFEKGVVERTRPAVLASRQACLDAHNWERLMNTKPPSPLLTRREMRIQYK
jgi:2-polyprenyl-6-methoxyphenol hydroxylase-like FAD-dependent oxidoreductase